jgi:transcriptional regulator with XRE-family HTH domain
MISSRYTYQQLHKYEMGINRIASGRLYRIAQALGVEVSFFYEGIDALPGVGEPTAQQRILLELIRNVVAIADRRQQEAFCTLARSLAYPDHATDEASNLAADGEVIHLAS